MSRSSSLGRTLALLAACLIVVASHSAVAKEDAPKNLVDNPSFDRTGEDPVPDWTVRLIARKTEFRVEGGVLVAERSSSTGISADSCLQRIYLPQEAKAIRVRVRAAAEKMRRAEFVIRFTDRSGAPLFHATIFRLDGTFAMEWRERDLELPENASDAEIELKVWGEGRVELDEVVVHLLDPSRVAVPARIVVVRGGFWISPPDKTTALDLALIEFPVPPVTETQAPCRLSYRSEPGRRIRGARLLRSEARELLQLEIGPLPAGEQTKVFWESRVVVTELEGFRNLPAQIESVPVRHLRQRYQPWATLPAASGGLLEMLGGLKVDRARFRLLCEAVCERAGRTTLAEDGPVDPVTVARTGRGSAAGRANLAAALLRAGELPARPVLLVPIGTGPIVRHGVEAFHRDHGWLRFGLASDDPRPVPFVRDVLLSAGPATEWTAFDRLRTEDRVRTGLVELEGVEGGDPIDATEVAILPLGEEAGPDLVESIAKGWERATRKFDPAGGEVRIPAGKLALKGKARHLKSRTAEILGDEE